VEHEQCARTVQLRAPRPFVVCHNVGSKGFRGRLVRVDILVKA
jgi:hypothetical protein